ncbi:MAG: glucosaminidase domain-containing protein [Bacteroidales bacterium]|nr:glucosaminidase domain-containing protein [Bacteroidales bacterium]
MKIVFIVIFIQIAVVVFGQKTTTEEYIEKYKYIAIKEMHDYKIPASITLAQGILESGSGNSRLAVEANNHFGIKCHNDWNGKKIYKDDDAKNECFRVYKTPEQSFRDHSVFLATRDRYSFLFDYKITDYEAWAKGLKKAGYATNDKYPKLLIDLIERYGLDQYDKISPKELEKMLKKDHVVLNDSINYSDPDKSPVYTFDSLANPESSMLQSPDREILYNNRIKYVIAKKDDHIELLADELDMFIWEFYKYNEIPKGSDVKENMIVYLQPKRKKAEVKTHVVKKGETVWDISQKYGIKTIWIYKRNNLPIGAQITEGQELILRGRKK